jgi:hypothetical protein
MGEVTLCDLQELIPGGVALSGVTCSRGSQLSCQEDTPEQRAPGVRGLKLLSCTNSGHKREHPGSGVSDPRSLQVAGTSGRGLKCPLMKERS